MGFYGTKIAYSASKPNAVERRMGKLGDSIPNTTITFKIELLWCLPGENWFHVLAGDTLLQDVLTREYIEVDSRNEP